MKKYVLSLFIMLTPALLNASSSVSETSLKKIEEEIKLDYTEGRISSEHRDLLLFTVKNNHSLSPF